jgi:hypothetical protein
MDLRSEQTRACPFAEGLPREDGGRRSREAHLEAIRILLDSGCYDVPAMAIAERMLDRAAASAPGRKG